MHAAALCTVRFVRFSFKFEIVKALGEVTFQLIQDMDLRVVISNLFDMAV